MLHDWRFRVLKRVLHNWRICVACGLSRLLDGLLAGAQRHLLHLRRNGQCLFVLVGAEGRELLCSLVLFQLFVQVDAVVARD